MDFGEDLTRKLERQKTSPASFLRLLKNDFSDKHAITLQYREAKPYEQGFAAHYDEHIKPLAAQFEVKRKDALRKAAGRAKAAAQILTVVAILCVVFFVKSGSPFHAVIPLMIAYGLLEVWFRTSMTEYQDTVKSQIFPRILSFVGDFEYKANVGDRVTRFNRSGLIPKHDRESNEDEIKGSYKDVQIELFESQLESKRRSNNNTQWVSVFKGIIINLSMNKAFSGKTVIVTDRGAIGNFFKGSFNGLERVVLEDPDFEKKFEVYSTDQIQARYLLTTSFMERLKDLQNAFGGSQIEACFHRNSLLLMIPVDENLFEPGSIFVPEDFTDDARSLLAELQDIFAIIDTLKLDQKLNL